MSGVFTAISSLALESFEKPIINEDVYANFNLAWDFLDGVNGFELNPLKAYYWFKVAECQTGKSTSLDTTVDFETKSPSDPKN